MTVGPVGDSVYAAIGFGTNTTLASLQRWRNAGGFTIWRKKIVQDVFDEDSLAL
jgi:hypothetical protein